MGGRRHSGSAALTRQASVCPQARTVLSCTSAHPSYGRDVDEGRDWITWAQAGAMTGLPRSRIGWAIKNGRIARRGGSRSLPSLRRSSVEAFALEWGAEQAAVQAQKRACAKRRIERPEWAAPDDGDVWLSTAEAALVLGLTKTGVRYRADQDLIPHERRGSRLWFRRDHVEQVAAARAFRSRVRRAVATTE